MGNVKIATELNYIDHLKKVISINTILTLILCSLIFYWIKTDPEPVKGIGYLVFSLIGFTVIQTIFLSFALLNFAKHKKQMGKDFLNSIVVSIGLYVLFLGIIYTLK